MMNPKKDIMKKIIIILMEVKVKKLKLKKKKKNKNKMKNQIFNKLQKNLQKVLIALLI